MKTLFKKLVSKIGNWMLIWIWIILSIWIFGIIYAYNWNTLPNVWTGSWLSATSWNNMIENINFLKSNSVTSESFLWTVNNWTTIVTNNAWYVNFSEVQNSNSSVFEVVTTGNYWVKIKKAGKIMFNYDQDIISTWGNYVYAYSYIDGVNIWRALQAPTWWYWDWFHIWWIYNVSAWQILTIIFWTAGMDITNFDNWLWGGLWIIWIGNP